MNESAPVPVVAWWVQPCPSGARPVAVVRAGNGSELRLRLTDGDALWLARGRHPAYARHLQPMLEDLARGSLWLELNGWGSGTVSPAVVACVEGGLSRQRISPALALLLFQTGLSLYVDEVLFEPSPREDLEDVVTPFASFLATASAEDFARFDTEQR